MDNIDKLIQESLRKINSELELHAIKFIRQIIESGDVIRHTTIPELKVNHINTLNTVEGITYLPYREVSRLKLELKALNILVSNLSSYYNIKEESIRCMYEEIMNELDS